jgi:hypothetical protein
LAVVALAAIGVLVNTTRGRETVDQASAKRIVLAWLNETFVNAEAFDARQDAKRRSGRRVGANRLSDLLTYSAVCVRRDTGGAGRSR